MNITLSDEQLQEIYKWVDAIPLSRRKKNLPRDFSDAVLMAEVVAHFFPRLVELYNYDQGLKIDTKIYNWKTLNTRVFKKINYSLDQETINNLANAKAGIIEQVLWEVRQAIEAKIAQDQRPFGEDENQSLEDEIEAAKTVTDRKILDAKIKQVEDQAQYIAQLEEKIAKIEELIQMKDERILQLATQRKTTK
ncbi:hypothetical protein TRFO_24231 [Tritrichomonas foetus]|uniref:CH-like domain-containing protein n=1 Tax=Tritrichomonas foetus TaxID=1144522 RepID=A0A1J4KCW4_9EUKA|nr:hypothetical protein TRFO_24231 [Tritrichomonas foetus]|eukprot:OHT07494.1 hypothetical protein TRFO_24231 [Tritrichomonas foetus]